MESNDQRNTPIKDDAVREALASGRNANDNFQQEPENEYGMDESAPDADAEREERDMIKGGKGQRGVIRNRNDDFDQEEQ
ncbi:hypothetical protein DYBT9623_00149 [Dyadobacter sp. CECT 9623]|uniref:Uncharacterized protein n=1 Tax=Dyadobacter linearis TaxID=2823330 RepID=A0ABM8UJ40_9BACT|nr:hypothetical protein [Dyadobacter sp. CECT 9623]CAG5067428.1 hypothetical protein DYBT9623_00149 [Dyadobacter sp. CECT 9623]